MIQYVDLITDDLKDREYYKYWNDTEVEKGKVFWIRSVEECQKIIEHEKDDGIYDDLQALAKKYLSRDDKGISLASGVCWEGGLLFNWVGIRKMDFLDYSKHRIFDLGKH